MARELDNGILIGAIVAVNALGSVFDPYTGAPVATPRTTGSRTRPVPAMNTTIGVIATNARLDSAAVNRLATLGHDGLAMAIRPAHTLYDGDALFAVSIPAEGTRDYEPVTLGFAAAEVVAEAIVRAVRAATPLHNVPSVSSIKG